VRRGWCAVVHRVSAATARWSQSLLAGHDLARAFDVAGEGFDFAAWLAVALREKWLKAAQAEGDKGVEETFAEPA
jgi:hypothetical protein